MSARRKISYLEYLIWTAAKASSSLTNAIDMALTMDSEIIAVEHLEHALNTVGSLATPGTPNYDRVEERPQEERP